LSGGLLSLRLGLGGSLRLGGSGLLQLGLSGSRGDRLGSVGLGGLGLEGALSAVEALEGLPVAGDLEQREDLLGRLRADAQPVLGALTIDVDERGLLGGVVLADLLDHATIALGARVGDDDTVEGRTDLAEADRKST